VKTAVVGGATVTVAQGTSLVLICDGTSVYNAASGSSSTINALTIGNGSLGLPSLKFVGDPTSGLYLVSGNQVGLVINNILAGYYDATGLVITNAVTALGGISGGTF
jgi:hypothetical protein